MAGRVGPNGSLTSADGEWPLTGRDAELCSIIGALDDPGGVLLAGGAGVGKTRLARAALITQAADRVQWVIGTHSARSIPLGAFGPLFGPLPGGSSAALPTARTALREGRTLLVVDDAHLLDDVSATLLNQLAVDRACRMVVTVRTGEPAPDAVTTLWKDGLLTRLEVPALSQEDTTTLLERVLGGRLERVSARRLFTATAGNVLWLRYLVDGERADKRLMCSAGVWHWTGEPRLGAALTALIDTRIGELSGDLRRLLDLLALGEPLGAELLQSLTGAAAIEDGADRSLVTVQRLGGRWEARLAHPLYGEAVRARMNPVRARRLRGQLVKALTDADDHPDVLRHAVLAVDSDLPPDPVLLLAAAYRATLLTDSLLAERLVRAARDSGAGFEAQLVLAFQLCWLFRGDEAEREFTTAAAMADTDARRLRVAQARAVNLYFLLARVDDAYAVLGGCNTAPEQMWKRWVSKRCSPQPPASSTRRRLWPGGYSMHPSHRRRPRPTRHGHWWSSRVSPAGVIRCRSWPREPSRRHAVPPRPRRLRSTLPGGRSSGRGWPASRSWCARRWIDWYSQWPGSSSPYSSRCSRVGPPSSQDVSHRGHAATRLPTE